MGNALAIIGANLKGNVGDFALLDAALSDLHRSFPQHSIDVYSQGFLSIDERRLEAFHRASAADFRLAGRTFSMEVRPAFAANLAKSWRFWPRIQRRLIDRLARQKASEAAAFEKYDRVFVVGGAQWGGFRVGISMFSTLVAVAAHNSNIFAYPFSIDSNIESFNERKDLQRYFRLLQEPVLVRDSISSSVLDEVGIGHSCEVDSAFLLHERADDIGAKPGRDGERIIVCLAGAAANSLQDFVRKMEPSGREVCFMTTCWNEDEESYSKAALDAGVDYIAPLTWQDAVAEIKASALLVTNRLHGLIFSCLGRSAALPITNRQKSRAFAKDAEMPWSAPSLDDLTPALVGDCLSGRERIVKAMSRYRTSARLRTLSPLSLVQRSDAPG